MDAAQYRKHLERLELTSEECAALFGYSVRTSVNWNRDGPPKTVAALIILARTTKHLKELLERA
jgi:hypothetical protein